LAVVGVWGRASHAASWFNLKGERGSSVDHSLILLSQGTSCDSKGFRSAESFT